MDIKFVFPVILSLLIVGCAHASTEFENCQSDPSLQKAKSSEIQKIEQEDQADRSLPYDSIDWKIVSRRDLKRRIEIASIFAEGCFKDSADYRAAALVYQHGDWADQYYQAFIWAKTAVKLGDESQGWLAAAALDRFLVKSGQKQLFGTQFSRDPNEKIWCIEPLEESFPEARRFEYLKKTLKESVDIFISYMKLPQTSADIPNCKHTLKASPAGTVPGFW